MTKWKFLCVVILKLYIIMNIYSTRERVCYIRNYDNNTKIMKGLEQSNLL